MSTCYNAGMQKFKTPECAYEHCHKHLSIEQHSLNRSKLDMGSSHAMALYCCRRHKELAAQRRRRTARNQARLAKITMAR